MANDQQFKLQTKLVATRGVKEYRATIPTLVAPGDSVLEIGCAWGNTTRLLAAHCRHVIGADISADCISQARQANPNLNFARLDAFDVRAVLELGHSFSKIYMDLSGLSGYRSLLDLIALLTMYATVLRPQLIVVKSGALKQFARQCQAWDGSRPRPGSEVQ